MIVLDDPDRGVPPQDLADLRGTSGIPGRTGGGLGRGVTISAPAPLASAVASSAGRIPRSSTGTGTAVKPMAASRSKVTALPFAVVRMADDTVIGSTRFFDLGYWLWPEGLRPVQHHRGRMALGRTAS